MKNRINLMACIAILLALIANTSSAESLRCGSKLANIGDTKADIIEKCGEPAMTDSYCEAVAVNQAQGIQNGNNNIQNNITINTCENVDIWTYNPGSGKFMAHLYFSRGQLMVIRYGSRVK